MKVLVTGGAGFIGSWVAAALVERGDEVMVVDNFSGGDNKVVGADIRRRDLVSDNLDFISEFAPEVVFNACANAREGASQYQPSAVVAANSYAAARTFEAAIKGKKLQRITHLGTMARFGAGESFVGTPLGPPFDEVIHRASAEDVYATSKIQIEGMLQILADVFGFKWTILNPHNVIGGAGQCGAGGQRLADLYRNVAALSMNRINRNEPLIVFGDGEQVRAFSAIQDALPCFIRAIDGASDGQIVNVGGGVPITVNTLMTAIKEAMFVPDDYPTRHLPDRKREVKNAYCTTERSVKLLGYEEKMGWRECIADMAIWARSVGPVPWTTEKLTLDHESVPEVWR